MKTAQLKLFSQPKYKHKQPDAPDFSLEKWVDAFGYANRYEISNYGRIRSKKDNNIFKLQRTITKGKLVTPFINIIKFNKIKDRISVARLMYQSFINNNIKEYRVVHLDNDIYNNHLENLGIKLANPKNPFRLQYDGKKYDGFLVLKRLDKNHLLCKCDCGTEFTKPIPSIKKGIVKCCGNTCSLLPTQETIKIKTLFRSYKYGARKRKYQFILSIEEFTAIIHKPCYYCDSPPLNGVDRMDNTLGYTTDNTVPCCKQCNYSKRDTPLKDWIVWIKRVSSYIKCTLTL